MVYSERVLALAHVGAEKMLDVIPLNEIISIQDCDGVGSADADDGAGRVMLEITLTVRGFHVLISENLMVLMVIWCRIETLTGCCPKCSNRPASAATIPRTRRKASCKYSIQLTPTRQEAAVWMSSRYVPHKPRVVHRMEGGRSWFCLRPPITVSVRGRSS